MSRKVIIAISATIILVVLFLFYGIEKTGKDAWTTVKGDTDAIRLSSLKEGEEIESPLVVSGEARGFWFFEADFPIILTDWNGSVIAESFASAQGEWMTEDYVPFEAVLEFEIFEFQETDNRKGYLILQKDNPSGLPKYDDALKVKIRFK